MTAPWIILAPERFLAKWRERSTSYVLLRHLPAIMPNRELNANEWPPEARWFDTIFNTFVDHKRVPEPARQEFYKAVNVARQEHHVGPNLREHLRAAVERVLTMRTLPKLAETLEFLLSELPVSNLVDGVDIFKATEDAIQLDLLRALTEYQISQSHAVVRLQDLDLTSHILKKKIGGVLAQTWTRYEGVIATLTIRNAWSNSQVLSPPGLVVESHFDQQKKWLIRVVHELGINNETRDSSLSHRIAMLRPPLQGSQGGGPIEPDHHIMKEIYNSMPSSKFVDYLEAFIKCLPEPSFVDSVEQKSSKGTRYWRTYMRAKLASSAIGCIVSKQAEERLAGLYRVLGSCWDDYLADKRLLSKSYDAFVEAHREVTIKQEREKELAHLVPRARRGAAAARVWRR
ncbi:hypothetical protein ACM66B_004400 [Microbotryomycetes sp. NB124-2]